MALDASHGFLTGQKSSSHSLRIKQYNYRIDTAMREVVNPVPHIE
jgi:hypothetical protein